jgi:hypothetical protein
MTWRTDWERKRNRTRAIAPAMRAAMRGRVRVQRAVVTLAHQREYERPALLLR